MKIKNQEVGHRKKPRKNNLKWILAVMAVLTLVFAMQVGTQYYASVFNYQPALGGSITHIYPFWSLFTWGAKFPQYGAVFGKAFALFFMVVVFGFLVIVVTKIILSNSAKFKDDLHGSARWANEKDLIDAGLLPRKGFAARFKKTNINKNKPGVVIGAWRDAKGKIHYLIHRGAEHILTIAPTRSGKGVGLVVPTLLTWTHSTLISDLKGELWALTAGWRKMFAKNVVMKLEPASAEDSVHWNPFEEVRVDTQNEMGDVQNIALMLVDNDGQGLHDHWRKKAYALFTGLILHVLYKAKNQKGYKPNLPTLDAELSNPKRPIAELWEEMRTYPHLKYKFDANPQTFHVLRNEENKAKNPNPSSEELYKELLAEGKLTIPQVAQTGTDMKDTPEEERGSIVSTAKSSLDLYRDPVVARNVSESNFMIKDLMDNKQAVSLYIVTKPNDKARIRPVVRLFITMVLRLLTDEIKFKKGRQVKSHLWQLLLMLDELPAIGKLPIVQESLAFMAGFDIRGYLIAQDRGQLTNNTLGYGDKETITGNSHIQNYYAPVLYDTAEYISKKIGKTTIVKEEVNVSGKRAGVFLSNVSKTYRETERALLTPDEVMTLPAPKKDGDKIIEAGDMLIQIAGMPPIYGTQVLFFDDPVWSVRAQVEPPKQSDRIIIPELAGTDDGSPTDIESAIHKNLKQEQTSHEVQLNLNKSKTDGNIPQSTEIENTDLQIKINKELEKQDQNSCEKIISRW